MNDNYTVYHLHSWYSNDCGLADSCVDPVDYIKLAKEQGMTAIAFSEHGNIYNWIKKKQECDKAGIKYIHGVELYLCTKLEADERGCHIGLYAKNWDGVKELNNLISIATSQGVREDKTDRHKYYNHRISLHELMNTSDNIIFTSACIASPLNRWDNTEYQNEYRTLIKWMVRNKHRCFFEIQYHDDETQKRLNKKLYLISKKTGIPLIAGTDTHSSNEYKAKCRKIYQRYKSRDKKTISYYAEEDSFDLTWKTYDELVEMFKIQNVLPVDTYLEAIENTNKFANMIEDFSLDKTFKYPTLYGDNVTEQWKELIYRNFDYKLKHNQLKLPSRVLKDCKRFFENKKRSVDDSIDEGILETYKSEYQWAKTHTDIQIIQLYKNKIVEEFKVMRKLGMESFMMFMSELISWCKDNEIPCGTGRGSVCGSMIAFITNITDVDPIMWNTVFSRFCNEDRISLGDIDCDFAGEDREKVYQYIINRFTPEKTAYIAAFQTLKVRGCIDVLAGGLGYTDLDKVMNIKNTFDEIFKNYSKIIQEEVDTESLVENGETDSASVSIDYHDIYLFHIGKESVKKQLVSLKRDYDKLINNNQDLFYYLDGLKGTVVSKGIHPSGIIGSPITLSDNIGLYYKDGDMQMPVSSCAMKAVDSLNYVKFDILGLKTVGIIKDTCKFANIEYPKSYELNWNDSKTWHNMITAQQGVFQFEGDYAFSLLKDFKPFTINHMSMVNAALRPSGKSYRNRLIAGEHNNNPSKEIDDLLQSNNGYLIFQEDTIKFLTDICGFTGSAADTTRRAIGKKDKELLQQQLPKILKGYCDHSSKPRNIAEDEAKQFIQIVQDSSEYQFGYNHSTAYSMNGYECVWLRTYYPIEFIAAYLNRAENNEDTINGIKLAEQYNIIINPIKFGKSSSQYTIGKEHNAIYKGIESIKFCNSIIADELLSLAQNKKYDSFINLLDDINQYTSVNTRQLKILTGLNFFSDFGNNQYLLTIIDLYNGIKALPKGAKSPKTILPSIRNIKQFKKDKLEIYREYGITENLIKKYSEKETAKQYSQVDNLGLLIEVCKSIPNKPMSVKDYVRFERENLDYVTYQNSEMSDDYYIVTDFTVYKDTTKPNLVLRKLKTGEDIITRIKQGKIYKQNPFGCYDILKIQGFTWDYKKRSINGEWKTTDELEPILEEYEVM